MSGISRAMGNPHGKCRSWEGRKEKNHKKRKINLNIEV
jgi:hypothetical protein